MLGKWWIANPADDSDCYEVPSVDNYVPGTLQNVAHRKYALETIGLLGESIFATADAGGQPNRPRSDIWGIGRDGFRYSLFDNLQLRCTEPLDNRSAGGENWTVGWLARGNAWVTPGDECVLARVQIDDLDSWALHLTEDKIEIDETSDSATIDLRREVIGSVELDAARVSLIRVVCGPMKPPGREMTHSIFFRHKVYWELEGAMNLQWIKEFYIPRLESFVRFLTMRPYFVIDVECDIGRVGGRSERVSLIIPRSRHLEETNLVPEYNLAWDYLATPRTLSNSCIDLMSMLSFYWSHIATGNAYMSMALHLESQDRYHSRAAESALLNATQAVESLYSIREPELEKKYRFLQAKIDWAIRSAGSIGDQVLNSWGQLSRVAQLRNKVAHGEVESRSGLGLQCLGSAKALQWILRLHLLRELGLSDEISRKIVAENNRYCSELKMLQNWCIRLSNE